MDVRPALPYGAAMEIAKDCVAGLAYTLKDDDGQVIDTNIGGQTLFYLHGHGNLVPGLERELEGKKEGDELEVVVSPEEGYGQRDESRTFEVPKSALPAGSTPVKGMALTMHDNQGRQIPVTIAKVKLNTVVMDGNHPLAGKNLNFKVTVLSVRKAKREEIAHGHAHAPGHGHHH
jgi:FKBP-type peptidyl-prolyl cis-trans isomerase SlyD